MCEGAFILIQGACGCSVRVFPGLSAGVVTHYLLYRAITHLPVWDMGPICGCSCLSLFRVACTPGSLVPPSLCLYRVSLPHQHNNPTHHTEQKSCGAVGLRGVQSKM